MDFLNLSFHTPSAETWEQYSTQGPTSPELGVPAGTDFENLDHNDLELPNFAARRADALGLITNTFMAAGATTITNAERYQVVVHVSEESIKHPETGSCCELEGGHMLATDTVRRLGCEAGRVQIMEDSEGMPLSVGRKTRAIPPAIRRALQARDGGCCFPGCTASRFTDAHHIKHWADGGETRLDNLVLICKHHHRKVHEDGFGLRRTHDGLLIFSRPDGRRIEAVPISPSANQTVEQGNRDSGLSIDSETGVTLWQGEVMDYDMAVEGLIKVSCK